MPRRTSAVVLVFLVWPMVQVTAQHTRAHSLMVRVAPESRIAPQKILLRFRTSVDGSLDLITQAETVAAWVRALPGQQIRVTGRLSGLQGPDGPVPSGAVRWTGSPISATGGARKATCSSGVFAGDAAQDLVEGWGRSGILTCAVNFELTGARNRSPGTYSGLVSLAVIAQ
jgi:hypothetical protein